MVVVSSPAKQSPGRGASGNANWQRMLIFVSLAVSLLATIWLFEEEIKGDVASPTIVTSPTVPPTSVPKMSSQTEAQQISIPDPTFPPTTDATSVETTLGTEAQQNSIPDPTFPPTNDATSVETSSHVEPQQNSIPDPTFPPTNDATSVETSSGTEAQEVSNPDPIIPPTASETSEETSSQTSSQTENPSVEATTPLDPDSESDIGMNDRRLWNARQWHLRAVQET